MMRPRQSARRRAVWVGVVAFVASALALLAAAGSYLAMHPSVGGWLGTMPSAGMNFRGTTSSHIELVRTREGVRYGRRVDEIAGRAPMEGTLLGSVDFMVARADYGWPRRTMSDWSVVLNSVSATADGPPSSDARAWRALLAEAYSQGQMAAHERVPAGLLRGDANAKDWDVGAFVMNAAERLWHAPLWGAASLGMAAVLGVVAGLVTWWRRKRPGACVKCGYDLAGLGGGVCPECGEVAKEPAGQ